MTNKKDTLPLGRRYLAMAGAYWTAAQRLGAGSTEADLEPFYHCACHSIELAIKAVLLSQGDTVETLMRLNHNLEVSLRSAVGDGLTDPPDETWDVVSKLSWAHGSQSLRYPSNLSRDLPGVDETMSVATFLLRLAQASDPCPDPDTVNVGSQA